MIDHKTTCPDFGHLRAWLDSDSGQSPDQTSKDHLAVCPACRAQRDGLRRDAELAARAIGALGPSALPSPAAVALARDGLARNGPRPAVAVRRAEPAVAAAERPPRRRLAALGGIVQRGRIALGGLAAAVALSVLVGTPAGQTAAAAFLAQFRSQRFAVVTLDPAQVRQPLAELERLGTVQGDRSARPTEVSTIAEASRRVGFPVKQPDPASLPTGLTPTPKVLVTPSGERRFTFDRAKARAYFESVGRTNVDLPAKLDGATLVVSVPAAVLLRYERAADSQGLPTSRVGLLIGQAGELTVGVEGNVTLDELRELLLGLPSLPPDLTRQLQGIQDWRNTLPIPVPVDQMNWKQTTIGGGSGLILADNSGLGSAAIWQRDGRVYGVAGEAMKGPEVERVADGLR